MEFYETDDPEGMVEVYSASDAENGYLNDTCYYESADQVVNTDYQPKQYHVDAYSGYGRSYEQQQRPKPVAKPTPSDLLRDVSLNVEELPSDLKCAFKILSELLSDSNKQAVLPFLEKIDPVATQAFDYYDKIKKPMWLRKMVEKFQLGQYKSITEFISDMHLMIENCYRYNGPDHPVSKKAMKLEVILEQKLVLLPRDIQEKARAAVLRKSHDDKGDASGTRSRRLQAAYNSNWLSNQVRSEQRDRQRDQRRQQMQERRQVNETVSLELDAWDESLMTPEMRQQLNAMWELPQIGLFLFLCSGSLNLGELVYWELERCMVLPRESQALQLVMTSLMSTPLQRERISGEGRTLMPYDIWEGKFQKRVAQWYKALQDCGGMVEKCCQKVGIHEHFFKVLGLHNPLEGRKFHELTFYQRICMLKALCEHCVETQEYLRDTIEMQPPEDQREYVLGTDASGATYLNFPQFCGADMRIYRQAKIELPSMDKKPAASRRKTVSKTPQRNSRKPAAKVRVSTSKSGRRVKQQEEKVESEAETTDGDSDNTDADDEDDDTRSMATKAGGSSDKSPEKPVGRSSGRRGATATQVPTSRADEVDSLFNLAKGGRQTRTSLRAKMLEFMAWDESPSATDSDRAVRDDDTGSKRPSSARRGQKAAAASNNQQLEPQPDVADDNALEGSYATSPAKTVSETDVAATHQNEKPIVADSEQAASIDNDSSAVKTEVVKSETTASSNGPSVVKEEDRRDASTDEDVASGMSDNEFGKVEVKGESGAEPSNGVDSAPIPAPAPVQLVPLPDVGPVMGEFELVADSVEALRQLITKLSEAPPAETSTPAKKSRKAPERPQCEKDLLERLQLLLQELEPWETKLQQCNRRAKMKLMKEVKTYEEECKRRETSKSLWDSDESEAEGAVGGHRDSDSDYAPSQDGDHCRRSKRNIVNKYVSSSAAAREAAVLSELDAGLGVSSWGRLRKRRIIPNNIEDQGMSSAKKMRQQFAGGSSSRYDSPYGRDSPASQSSSSSAYRGLEDRSLRPTPEQGRSSSVGQSRSATAASSAPGAPRHDSVGTTDVHPTVAGATVTAQSSGGRMVRMPWDQLQQLGVARVPGTDTLYMRSRPLPMTVNANAQITSASPRPPPVANRLATPPQQPQAAVPRGRIMNTPTLLRTAANASNNTGRVVQAPPVNGSQQSSGNLKIILPSASAANVASTTAPVRMVLPGGVNVLVKPTAGRLVPGGVPNSASRPAVDPMLATSQMQKNLAGAIGSTRLVSRAEVAASSALNLLAGTAAQLPQLGGSALSQSSRAENDAYNSNANDNAETDDSISPQSKSGRSSPTKSPPSKTIRQLLGPPGDAAAALDEPVNGLTTASVASSVPGSTASRTIQLSTTVKVPPPAMAGTGFTNKLLLATPALQAQVRPGAVIGQQMLQKTVMQPAQAEASAVLPQQVKTVQLTDSSGNVIFMTPQQLQKAMEAMRKNTAIDNAIRKAITTAVSTTLPTAQIKVTAGVSPLDQPSRKPYRPVTVVTSATKTPVAAVPQALSSSAAEKSLTSSASPIKASLSLGGHLAAASLSNGSASVRTQPLAVNAVRPLVASLNQQTAVRLANSSFAKVQLQQPGGGIVAAGVPPATQTVLVQQAAGNVVLGQNVMVNAQPLLVQQQLQQQQVLLLASGAGGLQTVVPVVIGSPLAAAPMGNPTLSLVSDNAIQQQNLVLSPVPFQQSQATDVVNSPLAAAKRLPLAANASPSGKIVGQQSSSALAANNGQLGQQVGVGDGALSVTVGGVPTQQQQQRFALINLNGHLIAAPTAGLLHNQIVPGAGK